MKRSPLVILFVTVVIDLLGFGIILPLLPVYITKFGGTPVVSGWLTASFSIAQFLFSPIWGRASDRWGRRPLILLSLIGSSIAFLVFGLANSLVMLFIGRVGAGILTAASLPTAQAYIADVTPPEKRSRGMALIGVAFGIGFGLGPWIGAVLGKGDIRFPALFVAGISFINFLFALIALPETHKPGDPTEDRGKFRLVDFGAFKNSFRKPNLGELLTVFSVQNFSFALLESTFTWLILVRFLGLHPTEGNLTREMEAQAAPMVGPIFGIVGVTIMIVQGAMMGGLAHRIGERRLVWAGGLILAAAMLWIGYTEQMLWLKVASALVAVGSGVLNPSLSSLISQVAGSSERGSVMGVQQGLGSLARVAAPLLGTWLLQQFGSGVPFYVSAALMLLAFAMSLRLSDIRVDEAEASGAAVH